MTCKCGDPDYDTACPKCAELEELRRTRLVAINGESAALQDNVSLRFERDELRSLLGRLWSILDSWQIGERGIPMTECIAAPLRTQVRAALRGHRW